MQQQWVAQRKQMAWLLKRSVGERLQAVRVELHLGFMRLLRVKGPWLLALELKRLQWMHSQRAH